MENGPEFRGKAILPELRRDSSLENGAKLLIPDATPYEEWKEIRVNLIGASDAGALLAWHEEWPAEFRPYGSALSIAHRLECGFGFSGDPVEFGVRSPAECGRLWEDGAWLMYERRKPSVIDQGKAGTYAHPDLENVVATPDRFVMDMGERSGHELGLVQIKIVFSTGAKRWKKDGEWCVPPYIVAQCMQEMAVTGRAWNDLFAVIDGTPHCWRLRWDADHWARIQAAIESFQGAVENGDLSLFIDGTQDARKTIEARAGLSRVTPTPREETIDLDPQWARMLIKLEDLKKAKREIDFEVKEIESRLRYDLDGSEVGELAGWTITCREQERRSIDLPRLKKESPEIWEKYRITTKTRGVLRIGRRKEENATD